MKVAICPLVSHDEYRSRRCMLTCVMQEAEDVSFETVVHINSKDASFVDSMSSFCRSERIRTVVTRSDGTPSTGKNGILDLIGASTYDGVCMVDGDDFLYPSFAAQMSRHLMQFPETDLLSTCAMDSISRDDSFGSPEEAAKFVELAPGVRGSLWGSNNWKTAAQFRSNSPGILWDQAPCWPIAIGAQMYHSRKLAQSKRFDPSLIIGEDVMMEHEVLAEYQNGNMVFFKTFCSDMYVYDRTLDDNIQNSHRELKSACFQAIRSKIGFLPPERCSVDELPSLTPPILYGWDSKVSFIRGLLSS